MGQNKYVIESAVSEIRQLSAREVGSKKTKQKKNSKTLEITDRIATEKFFLEKLKWANFLQILFGFVWFTCFAHDLIFL
jgi:hypothetical protein